MKDPVTTVQLIDKWANLHVCGISVNVNASKCAAMSASL